MTISTLHHSSSSDAPEEIVEQVPPLRLLIVDDDMFVLDSARSVLRQMEHALDSIDAATDVREARYLWQARGPYAVVYLDLMLQARDASAAIEFAQFVRKENPNTVLVAFTGFPDLIYNKDLMKAPFDDYLLKPVSGQALLSNAWTSCMRYQRRVRLTHCLQDKEMMYKEALDKLRELEMTVRLYLSRLKKAKEEDADVGSTV